MKRSVLAWSQASALGGAVVIQSMAVTTSARAQTTPNDTTVEASQESIADIIVTARKRTERLVDVPDSITVITGETLRDANINDVKSVALRVPNFSIVEAQQPGQPLINIRGIGSARGAEPPVAVVVDGVQLADASQITSELFDIERIDTQNDAQFFFRPIEHGKLAI